MCLLPPSKSILVARTFRSISLCAWCLAVSRRLAWALEACAFTLPNLCYSTPRSFTPRPDSILPSNSPSNRHASSSIHNCPHHVHSTWQCAAAISLQTLEARPAKHVYTTCTYICMHLFATPPHTHMHACIHPDMPHLPYQELLTHKQRNKHPHPCLASRPVLPVAERMASTRHAYMHATMQNETRAASRAFVCSQAKSPHHHRAQALWFDRPSAVILQ